MAHIKWNELGYLGSIDFERRKTESVGEEILPLPSQN